MKLKETIGQKFAKVPKRKEGVQESAVLHFSERHNSPCTADSFVSFLNMYKQPCEKLQKPGFLLPPAFPETM